mmetsp:Transcript_48528/g.41045  ORF Transcript_48528/g.41045 Transcript_48528/m.41045 type:complete len:257 (-) Transcript_48528:1548-2318(-)
MEPRTAIEVNFFFSSISLSFVSSALTFFSLISVLLTFESLSISMSSLSSNTLYPSLPTVDWSLLRISFSRSASMLSLRAISSTNSRLILSSSGRRIPTDFVSKSSSSPSNVTIKLIIVALMKVSGSYSGLATLVATYRRKRGCTFNSFPSNCTLNSEPSSAPTLFDFCISNMSILLSSLSGQSNTNTVHPVSMALAIILFLSFFSCFIDLKLLESSSFGLKVDPRLLNQVNASSWGSINIGKRVLFVARQALHTAT